MSSIGNNNSGRRASEVALAEAEAALRASRVRNTGQGGATLAGQVTAVSPTTTAMRTTIPGSHERATATIGSLHEAQRSSQSSRSSSFTSSHGLQHAQDYSMLVDPTTSLDWEEASLDSSPPPRRRAQPIQSYDQRGALSSTDSRRTVVRDTNQHASGATTSSYQPLASASMPSNDFKVQVTEPYIPLKAGNASSVGFDGYRTQRSISVKSSPFEGFEHDIKGPIWRSRAGMQSDGKSYAFALKYKDLSLLNRLKLWGRNQKLPAVPLVKHFSEEEIQMRLNKGNLETLDKGKVHRLAYRIENHFLAEMQNVQRTGDKRKIKQLMLIARRIEKDYFASFEIDIERSSTQLKSLARLQRVINIGNILLRASDEQHPYLDEYFSRNDLRPIYSGQTLVDEFVRHQQNKLFDSIAESNIDFLAWFKLTDKTTVNSTLERKTKNQIIALIQENTDQDWLSKQNILRKIDETLVSSEHFGNHEDYSSLFHLLDSIYKSEDIELRDQLSKYIVTSLANRGDTLMSSDFSYESRESRRSQQAGQTTASSNTFEQSQSASNAEQTGQTQTQQMEQNEVESGSRQLQQTNEQVSEQGNAEALAKGQLHSSTDQSGFGAMPHYAYDKSGLPDLSSTGVHSLPALKREYDITRSRLGLNVSQGERLFAQLNTEKNPSERQQLIHNYNINQKTVASLIAKCKNLKARIEMLEMHVARDMTTASTFDSDALAQGRPKLKTPKEQILKYFGEDYNEAGALPKISPTDWLINAHSYYDQDISPLYLGAGLVSPQYPQEPVPTKEAVIAAWRESFTLKGNGIPMMVMGLARMEAEGHLPHSTLWMLLKMAEAPERCQIFAQALLDQFGSSYFDMMQKMDSAANPRLSQHYTREASQDYYQALTDFSNSATAHLRSGQNLPFTTVLTQALKNFYVPGFDKPHMVAMHVNRIAGEDASSAFDDDLRYCGEQLGVSQEDMPFFLDAMYMKHLDAPAAAEWIKLGLHENSGIPMHTPAIKEILGKELVAIGKLTREYPSLYENLISGLVLDPTSDYTQATTN